MYLTNSTTALRSYLFNSLLASSNVIIGPDLVVCPLTSGNDITRLLATYIGIIILSNAINAMPAIIKNAPIILKIVLINIFAK